MSHILLVMPWYGCWRILTQEGWTDASHAEMLDVVKAWIINQENQ